MRKPSQTDAETIANGCRGATIFRKIKKSNENHKQLPQKALANGRRGTTIFTKAIRFYDTRGEF